MSKRIEPGCWAVIYKPMACCGKYSPFHGIPFLVHSIGHREYEQGCNQCGASHGRPLLAFELLNGRLSGAILANCKRINGPEESTTQTRELEEQ
jgi:hypothetical protein